MTDPINKITADDVHLFRIAHDLVPSNLLNEYQRIATKSAIYPGKGTPFGTMYCALGLAEAGEVQNKVKKMFRDDGCIDIQKRWNADEDGPQEIVAVCHPVTLERRTELIKEMGGNLWYLAALANEIGASLSEIALANLTELAGRTERGTLQGSGDDR